MRKLLLLLFIALLSANLAAQLSQRSIKSFDALKNSCDGDNWTFKTIEELKNRTESPYVTLMGPVSDKDFTPAKVFQIFDLSNNKLKGEVKDDFLRDASLKQPLLVRNNNSKIILSNNEITKVSEHIGLGYGISSFVSELRLDNNKLTSFHQIDPGNEYIGAGHNVFTIHQNEITSLRKNDVVQDKFSSCGVISNSGSMVRIDNNRLDFSSLCSVVPAIKYLYGYISWRLPGNPDCYFDYYPQKPLGGDYTEQSLNEGDAHTLSFSLNHPDNIYSWQLNGTDVALSTGKNYEIEVSENTAGVWRCKVTNPRLPDVTLFSYDMAVFMNKDNNRAADDFSISLNAIGANFPEDAVLGDFTGTDPDGDELFYRLPDKTADNSHFRIKDGKTLVSAEILYEKPYIEEYKIVVEAYDKFGGKFQKEFKIEKGDATVALPSNIVLSKTKVNENEANKAISDIFISGAEGFTPELVDGEKDNGCFKIVDDTLRTKEGLDYETKREYNVRITASKDGVGIKKDFVIKVVDVNDAPNSIVITNDRITTETKSGETIGILVAADQDPADIQFDFELTDDVEANKSFTILNNVLKLKKEFSSNGVVSVKIKVTDPHGAYYTQLITIYIQDSESENKAPIGAGVTGTVISSSMETGETVASIFMSDPEGDKGIFSCDNEYISIEGSDLKLKSKPDKGTNFELVVNCSDGENEIQQTFTFYVSKSVDATDIVIDGDINATVYPNPSSKTITVSGEDLMEFFIFDLKGRNVLNTKNNVIDISSLREGSYYLRIFTKKGVVTRKIVKQ